MVGERFDELAKILSVAFTRQHVLQLISGIGGAALVTLAGRDPTDARKKHRKHHGKRRRRKRKSDRVTAQAALCPGNQDKVCHCAPGNLGNCQVTGNGGGHSGDPLDCCCTINGLPTPTCSCDGSSCCKPAGTNCSNSGQCCAGLFCCNIADGIGTCQPEACCVPDTCAADRPGVCGTFDDGCGGEITCCADDPACCEAGQACDGSTCCTPLTCADNGGGCGTFSPGCGLPDIECDCQVGRCCGTVCLDGAQCCVAADCAAQLCREVVDCLDGICTYAPAPNQQPGPQCNSAGQFCCNGTECCAAGQTCSVAGCCTPLTCTNFPDQCGAFNDGCGGQITCGCDAGEGCCAGQCVAGDECCAGPDCAAVLCQAAACDAGSCAYTPVPDGDQGPLCGAAGEFCCNGDECCEEGQACTPQGCCTAQSCAVDHFGVCGTFDDGCGGQITCCADNPDCCEGGLACSNQTCCALRTCADFPGQCGAFDDGCGSALNCPCPQGQRCCNGQCVGGEQCCVAIDCEIVLCLDVECVAGECRYTPSPNFQPGLFCDATAQTCCNGNECCASPSICSANGCISPFSPPVDPCAGIECGTVPDGEGGEVDCGSCGAGETCNDGACEASGGKRKRKRKGCKGHGKAGAPCGGKKCKCKGGRRCHHGRCCETVGDGSRHCNADSDCCPGLTCRRRSSDQHKVCVQKPVDAQDVTPTAALGLALGTMMVGHFGVKLLGQGLGGLIG